MLLRPSRLTVPVPATSVLVLSVLVGVLAGCSGGDSADAGDATRSAAADPAAQAREAVTAVFTGYSQALLRRDFATACGALTDDARTALVADINTRDIPAQDCSQAYAALYSTDAAPVLDEQGRTIRITDVTVDGTTATLTYAGTVRGKQISQTIRAVQVAGGGWQIAPSA